MRCRAWVHDRKAQGRDKEQAHGRQGLGRGMEQVHDMGQGRGKVQVRGRVRVRGRVQGEDGEAWEGRSSQS